MLRSATVAASVGALLLSAMPASALTITNQDSAEHKIGLDMGNKESVHTIPGGGA